MYARVAKDTFTVRCHIVWAVSGSGAATVPSVTTGPPVLSWARAGPDTVNVASGASAASALITSAGARRGLTTYRYTAMTLMSTAPGASSVASVVAVAHSDSKLVKCGRCVVHYFREIIVG